jgi:translation initiation factor IF-1
LFIKKTDEYTLQMSNDKELIRQGIVTEALPNVMFRVSLTLTQEDTDKGIPNNVIAYLAGKMKMHRIKVIIGDKVDVLVDGYALHKGRIIRRHTHLPSKQG